MTKRGLRGGGQEKAKDQGEETDRTLGSSGLVALPFPFPSQFVPLCPVP